MRDWWGARELAALPGLPGTVQNIIARAQHGGWLSRRREGRGGGLEYHVSNLPMAARLELARRWKVGSESLRIDSSLRQTCARNDNDKSQRKADIGDTRASAELEPMAPIVPTEVSASPPALGHRYLSMPEWARKRADARAELVRAFHSFRALAGEVTLAIAELEFARRYSAGEIEVGDETRRMIPRLGAPTISRWRKLLARHGIAALADGRGNRRGAGAIEREPELRDFIVAMIVDRPFVSARQVHEALRANSFGKWVRTSPARDERGAAQRVSQTLPSGQREEETNLSAATKWSLPSSRTVTRFIARWRREHASELLALTNPDAWNSKYRLALADAASEIERLNQRWEIDATPADAMCVDGRHCVIALIDIYSRRVMFRVTRTVSAYAATLLMRRAILDWGVPEEVHGDNGKEFVSNHFQRGLDDLQIGWVPSRPFSGWEKPFVERVIGTVMHELLPMLPGFIGHSVADRQAIRSRESFSRRLGKSDGEIFQVKLTSEQLQQTLDRWARNVYANRAHSGLGDRTPNEVAAEWPGEVRRIGDERALDLSLAQAPGDGGMRMVGKEGIRVDGARFFAGELAVMAGERVRVLYDPEDLGRVYVYGGEPLQFICIAENLERAGVSRRDMANLGLQAQARWKTEKRAEARRLRNRIKPHKVFNAMLEAADANAADQASAAIEVIHETAALVAAGEAAEASAAIAGPVPHSTYDIDALERGARAIAEIEATNNHSNLPSDDELWERYQRLSHGEASDEDRRWMASYETTSECWARKFLATEKEREEASGPIRAAG